MIDGSYANVLITGGTSGIGAGLAARFLEVGANVLVTGRNQGKLAAMAKRHPGLLTFESDIGRPEDREALANHALNVLPGLNIVINNAGIQRRIALSEDTAPWSERQAEINMLLAGPVHLNALLIPALLDSGQAGAIVNVTSGGAYIPQPFAPVYSACKAALHSYTVTLRHSLRNTPIHVIELIPPAVATGLAGPGNNHGATVDDFCNTVFPQLLRQDLVEVGYGITASDQFEAAKKPYKEMFASFSNRFPTAAYASR
ncbi:Dehydrogenase protein DltE [Granulibacter bethesdensis]|uniref:Dehydrogenase protein DltE n=1 Tax=Granulibacter bethesdensis TaxID=364410 RepID=A0AAC9P913_9PROT|nr:SDR family NAD(P)-dependent oxidoreductase [Granulibacter bethesdensis]APH55097.1 Dehydrogenase protein DltE [Granulibacter bethesdensis]APH62683.1 Dehydrogenase protein DltE [Granulibacter bethesdensis]